MARPYVKGKDLIDAGLKPGPDFSQLLDYAHKLRLAGIEKDAALKQTLGLARQLEKSGELAQAEKEGTGEEGRN